MRRQVFRYVKGKGVMPSSNAEGARISWLNDEVRNARVKAMLATKDDPLYRALQRNRAEGQRRNEKGHFAP